MFPWLDCSSPVPITMVASAAPSRKKHGHTTVKARGEAMLPISFTQSAQYIYHCILCIANFTSYICKCVTHNIGPVHQPATYLKHVTHHASYTWMIVQIHKLPTGPAASISTRCSQAIPQKRPATQSTLFGMVLSWAAIMSCQSQLL